MTEALESRYRFDGLVVGPANQLAVTAAQAVAEAPGTAYNPLYLYGETGVGKTHLLLAIGHAVREMDPGADVEYLPMGDFISACATAVSAGEADAYRERFASADVLLIDDLHLLAFRRDLQLELLRILDDPRDHARQIVVAADRPAVRIDALDERLIRRCGSGLVTDITHPALETRVKIVRQRAGERESDLPDETLWLVASAEVKAVSQLLSVVDRLLEAAPAGSGALTPGRARMVLARLGVDLPVTPAGGGPNGASGSAPDEFTEFLSDVTTTVTGQLEVWRTKVAGAILRWEGEGYRTERLERLLEADLPADPESTLRAFAMDVERLRALESEALTMSPDLADSPIFRDPDQIDRAVALLERAQQGAYPLPQASPIWRLEDLVESPANRDALQSARAVVSSPGTEYNPLIVVGGHGCGKTHVLHAIANKLGPVLEGNVACVSAGDFRAGFERTARDGVVEEWRTRYRTASAFVLDDLHRLAGLADLEGALSELLEAFRHAQAQVVVSTSRPLDDLDLDDRLRSRLAGGLVVGLPPPDREIRRVLVERILAAKVGVVDPDLTSYLANRPVESVRNLQGLVQRLLNNAEGRGTPPTVAFARELLEGVAPKSPSRTARLRSSGVVVAVAGGLRSREKMVWNWPYASDRVLEEWA